MSVAIKSNINCKEISDHGNNLEADNIIIDIQGIEKKNNYILIIIYRNPNRNIQIFINQLNALLVKPSFRRRNIIVIGDININFDKEDKNSQYLQEIMEENNVIQTIEGYTRNVKDRKTKIDHCYSNISDRESLNGVIYTGITYHYAIYTTIIEKETSEERKTRLKEEHKNKGKITPISLNEMENVIQRMPDNKSPGSDEINMNIIKNNSKTLAPILTEITNNCLSTGIYPDTLKKVIVTPVFKKGEKTDPGNYRPISNINSFAKIKDKIINKKISAFLE